MRRRVRRLNRTFKHTGLRRPPRLLTAEREERQRQRIAFLRAVEYLPIAQFAARAKRDIARADAAKRKSQRSGAMIIASDSFVVFHWYILRNESRAYGMRRAGLDQAPFSPLKVTPSTSRR